MIDSIDPDKTLACLIACGKGKYLHGFDRYSKLLADWLKTVPRQHRPRLRGWPLGSGIIEYSGVEYKLVCADPCKRTMWLLVEIGSGEKWRFR